MKKNCDAVALTETTFAGGLKTVLGVLLLLIISRPAVADFETAEAAQKRGEYSEAYRACKSEADAGDAQCQNLVGYLFQEGLGVPANETEAIRFFRLAAKRGLAIAQCHLGLAYERGLGVTPDQAEAGHGIAKDHARAIEVLRHAADRGYVPAQIALAFELERYWGAARQPVRAYMWYLIAARTSSNQKLRVRAIQGQDRLRMEFSSQEIIAARSAAESWTPIGPRLEFGPLGARPASPPVQASNSSAVPKPVSAGSGFFVSHDGDLITDNHVIEGCRELRIVRDDKSNIAHVVATDAGADLAVLRVPGTAGDIASFRMDLEKPGEAVVVAGYPLQGLLTSKASVTTGIVSALAGPKEDKNLLQITAPVQPGNSGGPLVDAHGAVIGVVARKLNSLRVARATGSLPENINFAVKADLARGLLDKNGIKYD